MIGVGRLKLSLGLQEIMGLVSIHFLKHWQLRSKQYLIVNICPSFYMYLIYSKPNFNDIRKIVVQKADDIFVEFPEFSLTDLCLFLIQKGFRFVKVFSSTTDKIQSFWDLTSKNMTVLTLEFQNNLTK